MSHVKDRWTRPGPNGKRVRGERWGHGKRWLAVWLEHGREVSEACTTKDEADAVLAEHRVSGPRPVRSLLTVRGYVDVWLPAQLHYATQTVLSVRTRMRAMVEPHIGGRLLGEVTRADVQQMVVAWVGQGYAPSSMHQAFSFLSTMFAEAVHAGLVGSTPCVKVNLPPIDRPLLVPLTVTQVGLIRDRMPPWYQAMVIVGAATGLRPGELRGLTVDRIIGGDLIVDRQLVAALHGVPVFEPPKSRAGFRRISLGRVAAAVIEQHLDQWPSDGLIWRTRQGGPVGRVPAARVWKIATQGMGLKDRSGWHELRHHHASVLIAQGHSPRAVADRLGHADAAETMRTYAHLWPADHERMAEAADNALAELVAPKVVHLRLA